jgi:hypothetical protein
MKGARNSQTEILFLVAVAGSAYCTDVPTTTSAFGMDATINESSTTPTFTMVIIKFWG